MKIFWANLKQYVHRLSFFFLSLILFLVGAGILVAMTPPRTANGEWLFLAPAYWLFAAGAYVSILSLTILGYPFTFCLPKHSKIPRQLLFAIGLPLSLFWCYLHWHCFHDDPMYTGPEAFLSSFGLYTVAFWAGAGLTAKMGPWVFILLGLTVFELANGVLLGSPFVLLDAHGILQRPFLMAMTGGLAMLAAWYYWGLPDLARRHCGGAQPDGLGAWDTRKSSHPESTAVPTSVERFFLAKISSMPVNDSRKCAWGALYELVAAVTTSRLMGWVCFGFAVLVALLTAGFGGGLMEGIPSYTTQAVPNVLVAQICVMSFGGLAGDSATMVHLGRRHWLLATLTKTIAISLFVVSVMAALAWWFTSLDKNIVPLTLLILPFYFCFRLFYRRPDAWRLLLLLGLWFFAGLFAGYFLFFMIGASGFLLVAAGTWAVYIGLLNRVSKRWCLTPRR